MGLHAVFQFGAEARERVAFQILRRDIADETVKHVDLAPHLGAHQRAQGAGIGARVFEIAGNGGRVAAVQQVESLHMVGFRREAARGEILLVRIDADEAEPGIGLEAGALETLRDIDQPGEILHALKIARHPEQALGIAGKQNGIETCLSHSPSSCAKSSERTQVSFEPPPWLEFTIRLPRFIATRVRPPGRTQLSLPVTMKGRRSRWRGPTPSSTKVGATERPIIGWLIHCVGSARIEARAASSSSRVARGPMVMP